MKTIIIADKNDSEIQTLTGLLKRNDFVVHMATTAEEALSFHEKHRANMIIADLDIDLLRELHQFGSVRNLKDRRTDLFELKKIR